MKVIVVLILMWCLFQQAHIYNLSDGIYELNESIKILAAGLIELKEMK